MATANLHKNVDGDDANFAKLFQQIEARLALAPPEARAEVIGMLRGESEEEG